jgi:hypothetical protein
MSDLWTVLGGLTIPDVKVPDSKNPPGALVRLKLWLSEHVTDPTSRDRAVAAIENVRSVGALRNYTQHPSQETRRNAVAACSRLGLPYPIQDWAAAWDHVRAKVAEAFYILSQEAKA